MSFRYTFCVLCGCTPPDNETVRCDICGHTGCNGCIRRGLCQLCHDIEQERWT